MPIYVAIFGIDKAIARFRTLADGPPRRVLEDVAVLSVKAVQSNFVGNPLGWDPIKPETARRKNSTQILVGKSSTHMKDAIKKVISKNRVDLSSKKIYGGVHNFGWKSRNIPKRAWMVIREEWKKIVSQPLADWAGGRRK